MKHRAVQKRVAALLLVLDGFLPIEAFRQLLRSVRAYNPPNFTLNMRKDAALFVEKREGNRLLGWTATSEGLALGEEMVAKVAAPVSPGT